MKKIIRYIIREINLLLHGEFIETREISEDEVPEYIRNRADKQ